jgi:hypothetical protein
MTPYFKLMELYADWRKLSADECEGLEQQNWGRVAEAQSRKKILQDGISVLFKTCTVEQRRSAQIKEILSELIKSEQANQRLLEKFRNTAEKERGNLGGIARTLRRIQGSYGQQPQTVWHSYS